jgi:cytochrome c oxidase subunit 2
MLRRRGAVDLTPEEPDDDTPSERRFTLLLKAGTAITTAILLALTLASYSAGTALFAPQKGATQIDLIGHRWWWEVRYPEHGVVTANEIHIPAGAPVEAVLRSDDVIHSLWVPNLHGKMDLIPGQTNRLVFSAERPGTWRGQCAEFCGLQHAFMALIVVALPSDHFPRWLEQQQRPAPEPANDVERRGRQVFADNCAVCHTIRGFREDGKSGPDLTHVASRLSLASGRLDNSRGNRAGWIANAPHLKPGTYMPEFRLKSDELQALLAYLDRLE